MLIKTFKNSISIAKSPFLNNINRYFNSNQKTKASLDGFETIMNNNKLWSAERIKQDPQYFQRLVGIQKPQYLWIGCADSRVPANQIIGLKPGQIFVHRNIANLVPPSDINVLAVIQYSVEFLKVKHIIVTGHYGCGGIKAAFNQNDYGPLQAWLSYLRDLRSVHRNQLMGNQQKQEDDLVQLNVKRQVLNVARIPIVQKAWSEGQQLKIHGLVYNLKDGILKDLGITINSLEQIPPQFRVFSAKKP